MLSLPPSIRLFIATQPVDGRKGADSLMVIVRDVFRHDVFGGHLFIFFSRRRDRVRVVYWDRNGFAMWTKRLERGRFSLTSFDQSTLAAHPIESAELMLILEGIDLTRATRRARWEPRKSNATAPKTFAALNP